MRLLKPGVKATGMNIQNLTEQTNRPAKGVVTDKGVPQSDSFAKFAAVDSIDQRNNHVKKCSCGALMDETDIYSSARIRTVLLYPSVKAVGGDIKTCCNAGNRITTINNLFDCFNF